MKNLKVFFLLFGLILIFSSCGSQSKVEPIDQNLLIGTWKTESDVEKVTLVLNKDNTFKFEGVGFASEEGTDITLTETGEYSIENNQLILNIQDVQSSGLEYEDYQSENLGDLTFYIELKEDNTELDLTESSGSVAYQFKKEAN